MRAWIIVVSSAVVALVTSAAVMWPALAPTPRAAILPSLAPLLPTFTVAVLALYALCAILFTAGALIVEGLRLRRYLARILWHHGPLRPDWSAPFARSRFGRLLPPPAPVQPGSALADGTLVLQSRFQPHEARREVARLYYLGAARTHFISTLIVLAAAVVLGAAQSRTALPFVPGPIPMLPAALALVGLVLLALLARTAVDVAAEPLIDAISRLPAESAEAGLLRRTAELLAAVAANSPREGSPAVTVAQIPERFGDVLEQDHRALVGAIERLSATTDGLATTTHSSVEALEAAVHALELREQAAAQQTAGDAHAMAGLRDALLSLTALLRGSRASAEPTDGQVDPGPSHREREPDLALELRKLLQEIETTP